MLQPVFRTMTLKRGGKKNGQTEAFPPVSYTHLDVYKRQIEEIARVACELNQEMENIGARRLHTIMEKVLEEISYELPDLDTKEIIIDRGYVRNKILKIVKNKDLSKYIL